MHVVHGLYIECAEVTPGTTNNMKIEYCRIGFRRFRAPCVMKREGEMSGTGFQCLSVANKLAELIEFDHQSALDDVPTMDAAELNRPSSTNLDERTGGLQGVGGRARPCLQ